LGIYNKMIKQHGSDAHVNQEPRIVAQASSPPVFLIF